MPETPAWTAEERRRIEGEVRTLERPCCPRCDVALDLRRVPPRDDVAYVRDRVLVLCPRCRRTHVVDRRGAG